MSQEQPDPPPAGPPNPDDAKNAGAYSQQFQNQPVAARLPVHVGRGVFTTGVLIQDGPHEFVLDFLQALTQPKQIVGRVVLSPGVMLALVRTLSENLNRFIQQFGAPAALPTPPIHRQPTIQEIYENFKLPEEFWSGSYANSVLVGHGPAEFFLDFITSFYPTAAVSCRVYFAAQQAPRILNTLQTSLQQYQRKQAQQQQQHNPPEPPEGGTGIA
jgi:hypothetical protein